MCDIIPEGLKQDGSGEMLGGVGRSIKEWLIIFMIGLDLRIGVIRCFCS